jgi:WD40 repeat protein
MSGASVSREQRMQQIVAAYLQDVEQGKNPDRDQLLAQHPDLADELRSFLVDNDKMRRLVDLRDAATVGPNASADAPYVGTTVRYFGDYELLEEIARGGMGVVYKAKQISLNRPVALKMILAGQLASPDDVRRFHVEAEAAAKLEHPNIVPIYEVGEHEGQHFFSMKLVEGGSLAQTGVGNQGSGISKDSQRRAAQLMIKVARAVHYAHQRGILHRDLKPANVLLDAQGEPHITDFGLAKQVEGDSNLTQSGAIVGTSSYMPPEQAAGKKGLSTAVDIYSLGAILYELLTGQPPFRAATALDTLLLVLETEPTTPRSLNSQVNRDLETICLKCLNKEPARRYGSAEMQAEDLQRWLRGEPIQARPVRAAERLWRWCRRNPAVAATTTLAALGVVTAIAIGVVAAIRESDNAALLAQQELKNAARIAQQERESAQKERARDRERLRSSLIEQARALRLAGNRELSLEALRKAAEIRRDDELRLEACATIVRPGLRFLADIPFDNRFVPGGYATPPMASADANLVALAWNSDAAKGKPDRIEVHDARSGKLLGTKKGRFYAGAFRPGTAQLALVPHDQPAWVILWDPKTDEEIGKFEGAGSLVPTSRQGRASPAFEGMAATAFSTDGSYFLTENQEKDKRSVRVWNLVEKREAKAPMQGSFQGFLSGHQLVLLHQDRYLLWDCHTGEEQVLTPKGLKPVAYSMTSKLAALRGRLPGAPGEALHIWNLATGKRVGEIAGLTEFPKQVDFSPNGRFAVCQFPADQGKSMHVWDLYLRRFTNRLASPRGLQLRTEWPPFSYYPYRSFNPDGNLLASVIQSSALDRQSLCVWDTTTGEVLANLPGVFHWWSSDGQRMMVQGLGAIGSWGVTRPSPSYELGNAVTSLSLNPDGNRIAVNDFICTVLATELGQVIGTWDQAPHGMFPQFVGKDECWAVRPVFVPISPKKNLRLDGPVLGTGIVALTATSPVSGPVVACSVCQKPFEVFPQRSYGTEIWQLSPQQRKLLLPTLPTTAYPFHTQLGERLAERDLIQNKEIVSYPVGSVETSRWALSPAGPLLLRAGLAFLRKVPQPWKRAEDNAGTGVLELWNYQEGKRLALLSQRNESANWLQFSPDGRRFVMWKDQAAELEIWNTADCKLERVVQRWLRSFSTHISFLVPHTTFSADGRYLLAVYRNAPPSESDASETAALFNVNTGHEVQAWAVKKGDWQVFTLNADSTLAASGGEDKMLHLCDVASGRELARWPAHDDSVTALQFSRDGQTLYSGSQDGTLKIWNLSFIRRELKSLDLDW